MLIYSLKDTAFTLLSKQILRFNNRSSSQQCD